MVLRITTWNVNGIRNPFSYQPWREKRSYAAMFDTLEADIVVMQETKIQRKDLQDDMVLVSGWDCYFSLPKYKKGQYFARYEAYLEDSNRGEQLGYSGVAIYTRQSACAPIRAEEGVTGALCPPGSSTSYLNLPENECIGGYPTLDQLSRSPVDAATLDSEGRCVLLEFPAFVLIGVYSPATRDQSRDDFRLGFLNALDARVRNLVAEGKRVILTGDLNIMREEIDTANAEELMRKYGMSDTEFVSTPSRRLLNQLLVGGKVLGGRDEGREKPVMWDICREFNKGRKGMFTHWEQKINARPGNFGSRIDYILCSHDMKDWFCSSNIQEGLLGSDHCPVYAIIKDHIRLDDTEVHISDLVNPSGVFKDGNRLKDYSVKSIPALSAKLIPEFDRRRNIRDMFTRKPSLSSEPSKESSATDQSDPPATQDRLSRDITNSETATPPQTQDLSGVSPAVSSPTAPASPDKLLGAKRPAIETPTTKAVKRSKSASTPLPAQSNGKGQQSLKGFFKSKALVNGGGKDGQAGETTETAEPLERAGTDDLRNTTQGQAQAIVPQPTSPPSKRRQPYRKRSSTSDSGDHAADEETETCDPIAAKESWSKLFSKRHPPKCEGHKEHCIQLTTKKPGINCGRAFWICPR
ncbi:hypothetical protein GP486_001092 [Trichoglossum hirsutum]|uniref:DNA-(apurinic or apyrimidinic site) endonuclease 2 n=1 Tax=Trichoglossum hirsutum TaxID=265104 RepID=A0A9P8RTF5_9PEZI|nr:hypothetical protein GP486_001092 [Trichoglossum hirsutum]